MKIPHYIEQKNNIGIRPFAIDDAKSFQEAVFQSLDHMTRYVPWSGSGFSFESARNWVTHRVMCWQNDEQYSFIIYDTNTNRLLGFIDIDHVDFIHRCASMGYWVRKDAINKSIATTAVDMAARFAFESMKINRVEIAMDIENIASQRVAEKVGAKKEGILRNRFYHHGKSHSAVVYSIIPEDLK